MGRQGRQQADWMMRRSLTHSKGSNNAQRTGEGSLNCQARQRKSTAWDWHVIVSGDSCVICLCNRMGIGGGGWGGRERRIVR